MMAGILSVCMAVVPATTAIASEKYDLVISDMAMPMITGDIFAAKVMAARQNIPVILCTGYSKRMNAEKALALGIKALVNKPIKRSDLAKTVRKVLEDAK